MSEAYVVLIVSDDEHACLGDMRSTEVEWPEVRAVYRPGDTVAVCT